MYPCLSHPRLPELNQPLNPSAVNFVPLMLANSLNPSACEFKPGAIEHGPSVFVSSQQVLCQFASPFVPGQHVHELNVGVGPERSKQNDSKTQLLQIGSSDSFSGLLIPPCSSLPPVAHVVDHRDEVPVVDMNEGVMLGAGVVNNGLVTNNGGGGG